MRRGGRAADDEPALLGALCALISGEADRELVGTARDGFEAIAAALRTYVDESSGQERAIYRLEDRLDSQPDEDTRIILCRTAREALSNVRKHARANEAEVLLEQRDEHGNGGRVLDPVDRGRSARDGARRAEARGGGPAAVHGIAARSPCGTRRAARPLRPRSSVSDEAAPIGDAYRPAGP